MQFQKANRERMDETHLSVFHSVSNRAHSLPRAAWYPFNCFFFFSNKRLTFTLHDLTDFYVERVTAHRIKRNDHSCFHNSWPNSKTKQIKTSLRARGPPGVSGALRSLRILPIGRIGSAKTNKRRHGIGHITCCIIYRLINYRMLSKH